MDAYTQHIEQRHAELFAILADLNAGLKFGSITSLTQVRDIVSPLFPEPSRAHAPQNPATLIATGKVEA